MFTIKCVRNDNFHNNIVERVFSANSYEVIEYANGLKFIELYNGEDTVTKHLTIANGLLLAATDYHVPTHYNTAFMTNENGKTVSTARSVGNSSDHMVSVFHKLFHGCKASMLWNNFRRELVNVSTFTGWLIPLNEDEGIAYYARLHCMTQLSEDDARTLFFSGWGVELEKGFTENQDTLQKDMEYIRFVGMSNKFDLGPAENVADVYQNSYQLMLGTIKPAPLNKNSLRLDV